MSVDLLQTQPLLASCEAALAERYRVHRLFEAADPAALLDRVGAQVRAVAGGPVTADLIARLPALEVISHFGVGVDSVDVEAARARGIRVTNTPGVLNDAVAELGVGLILALARRLPQADRFVREGGWLRGGFPLTGQVAGTTLGIVGLGRIGREIASRAEALKMRVRYHGRHPRPEVAYPYHADVEDLARQADWLLVITPGGDATRGLISRRVLEALGPQGCLVNLGRGSSVDEAALIDLLTTGRLGGAALDVFADEPRVPEALRRLDNVVLSPHQGSATEATRQAMGRLVVANLDAWFAGQPLPSEVL